MPSFMLVKRKGVSRWLSKPKGVKEINILEKNI
jgi:hypothetical protein